MLHVWEFGPAGGRIVVALHGLKGYGGRWRPIAGLLAPDGIRIVAPDLRGSGGSPYEGPWTLEQHADDVLGLRAFDHGPLDVVGQSFGGAIAVMMAARNPSRIRRMVLLDPSIGVPADLAARNAASETPPLSFGSPAEAAASRAAHWPAQAAELVDEEVRQHLRHDADGRWRWRLDPTAAAAAHYEVARDLRLPDAIPVLILRATRGAIPATQVDEWRSQGAIVTDIECGHQVTLERPAETAEAIRRFLGGP